MNQIVPIAWVGMLIVILLAQCHKANIEILRQVLTPVLMMHIVTITHHLPS